MARRKPKQVLYRRKREGRTNYAKRLTMLIARKTRLVVRLTNQRVIAQLIEFTPQG
ncbi:MAG: 50S ribosomal protein L18, partial [Nanoarchaeota archaeon]|nr:50S ribosomal protein L18 [Nanoarchaeota archaeon]